MEKIDNHIISLHNLVKKFIHNVNNGKHIYAGSDFHKIQIAHDTYNKKYREILCRRDAFLQSIQKELNIRLDGDNVIADIPDMIGIEDDKNGKEK